MDVCSVVFERKSARVGPALRLSLKVVWGRRSRGRGLIVARHRTDEVKKIGDLGVGSNFVCVCAITVRYLVGLRIVAGG